MAKLKLTVTLTPETIKWVDEQVKKGRFADRSHAVQFSLMKVKKLLEKGDQVLRGSDRGCSCDSVRLGVTEWELHRTFGTIP